MVRLPMNIFTWPLEKRSDYLSKVLIIWQLELVTSHDIIQGTKNVGSQLGLSISQENFCQVSNIGVCLCEP